MRKNEESCEEKRGKLWGKMRNIVRKNEESYAKIMRKVVRKNEESCEEK